MKKQKFLTTLSLIFLGALLTLSASPVRAQEKHKREYVQAVATGTSTQLGRIVSVELIINDYSTAEDRAALLLAFQEKGSKGLTNALDKMSSKGRIAITGTLGFDVNFIRSISMPDGTRRIRFVTDRPILFGEAWSSSRSMDYSLSMGEIIISPTKGKSTGAVYPVAMFKLDDSNELGIETYQNPWKLVNIKLSN